MEKLAENDLTYFYLPHVVIVVAAVTTISLTPVLKGSLKNTMNGFTKKSIHHSMRLELVEKMYQKYIQVSKRTNDLH